MEDKDLLDRLGECDVRSASENVDFLKFYGG